MGPGRFTLGSLAFARSGKQLSAEVVEEGALRMNRAGMVGSPAYRPDESEHRQRARAEWEYSKDSGAGHQGAALLASGNRLAGLRTLSLLSLVIHGGADILAPLKVSQLIAKAIARARLVTFSGMGHDLPYQLWPDIAEANRRSGLGPRSIGAKGCLATAGTMAVYSAGTRSHLVVLAHLGELDRRTENPRPVLVQALTSTEGGGRDETGVGA